MISEKGSLRETPVTKLLLGIFEQALTGILYIKNEEILKVLYFNRGKLIWAISNSDEDKLENILAARNIVDPSTLLKVKREAHVSESIGKLLVEKGLITLEELIDSSNIQLKRIIISILKWQTGGFQFVKEAPPERLLSLDLSITNFIVDFILDEMDISNIWKEIGSLQVELMKNPDEEKLTKYKLSEKQMILLNSFTGKEKLETILSRYSGGHRESLLKIIYFFLMSELLIKKEFELADPSIFEEHKGSEYFHPEEQDIIKIASSKNEDFMFTPQEKNEIAAKTFSADSMARMDEEVFTEAKTKKIKMASLILIILILLLGGIILLILPLLLNENPIDKMSAISKNSPSQRDIITIEERKPEIEKEEIKLSADEKHDLTDAKHDLFEKKNPEEENNAVKKPGLSPGKSAAAYFQEGSMIIAGDIWKQELLNAGIKYSILLEMDCQKDSVLGAFDQITEKADFFILNKPAQERTCFLVMWGKYQTIQEAERGLKLIPNYFWQQPNPPEVIDLTKYL